MMKPNTRIMGCQSWLFKLKGGPFSGQKYRITEPLPAEWKLTTSTGGTAVYVRTEHPDRKRWPIMYEYDEERSDDPNRSRDSRTRRLERLRKAILFGPEHWYRRPRT